MSAREDSDLARAIAENDLPAIVRRVRAGPLPAAVTGDGQTCVMLAARFDRPALLRGFLARGVPVDARTRSGMTALMLAAGKGSSPCVRILLHAGADPSLGNDRGLTALDIARENRRGEVAELLETWSPPDAGPGDALFVARLLGDVATRGAEEAAPEPAALEWRQWTGLAQLDRFVRDGLARLRADATTDVVTLAERIDAMQAATPMKPGVANDVASALLAAFDRCPEWDAVEVLVGDRPWEPGVRAPATGIVWPLYDAIRQLRRGELSIALTEVVDALVTGLEPLPVGARRTGNTPARPLVRPVAAPEDLLPGEVDAERLAALRAQLGGTIAGSVVPLGTFFRGNNDPGSFGYNLPGDIPPQLCYRYLLGVARLKEVAGVYVRLLDAGDRWPSADTLLVVTTATPQEAQRWLPREIAPDAIVEESGDPLDVPPGHRVLRLWWR